MKVSVTVKAQKPGFSDGADMPDMLRRFFGAFNRYFDRSTEGYLRWCFAATHGLIERGVELLARFLDANRSARA